MFFKSASKAAALEVVDGTGFPVRNAKCQCAVRTAFPVRSGAVRSEGGCFSMIAALGYGVGCLWARYTGFVGSYVLVACEVAPTGTPLRNRARS